jgi:hypothetical protein
MNEVDTPDQVARYIGKARHEVERELKPLIADWAPLTTVSQTGETVVRVSASGRPVDSDLRIRTKSDWARPARSPG